MLFPLFIPFAFYAIMIHPQNNGTDKTKYAASVNSFRTWLIFDVLE